MVHTFSLQKFMIYMAGNEQTDHHIWSLAWISHLFHDAYHPLITLNPEHGGEHCSPSHWSHKLLQQFSCLSFLYLNIKKKKHWSPLAAAKVTSVVSDSVRPHRRQPTSLLHPWDFPGKSLARKSSYFCLINIFEPVSFLFLPMAVFLV